jgi:Skp family chaperone for outer membrane proteins
VSQPRLFTASVVTAVALVASPMLAHAQNQEWFMPNQPRAAAPRPAARPAAPPPQAMPPAEAAPGLAPEPGGAAAEIPPEQLQVQLPPPPEVPPLPKGPTPPAAIVGVLSVGDVMRASTAFQSADKEFLARRQKLNEDAQKEQVALRDLGQQLGNDRAKLTPEQIRQREKELQDRITDSRRTFGDRNRIIQEASQYVMAQIDRAIELVTQQVAVSRGINLVLNRAQILGTTNDFDMTPEVVADLNKVFGSVVIPPEGVSPLTTKPQASSGASSPGATPASASAPAAAQAQPAAKPPAKSQRK